MGHILIKDLSKSYLDRRRVNRSGGGSQYGEMVKVLDGINLEFEEGEMVCILGPSGCGKSTLLRIIAGFDHASEGRVLIDERPVNKPESDHVFVFQENGLLPWMTVHENVALGIRNLADPIEKEKRIQDSLELVDLLGIEHRYPHQLSGGMQRRAELARALTVNPDILFMDEPFTGLDYLTHLRIREEVVNLHEYLGKTMIMVTHFIEDALVMADRIVVLGDRPAVVKMTRKLEFSRPRNTQKQPLDDLKDEIFLMLGVSYVV